MLILLVSSVLSLGRLLIRLQVIRSFAHADAQRRAKTRYFVCKNVSEQRAIRKRKEWCDETSRCQEACVAVECSCRSTDAEFGDDDV